MSSEWKIDSPLFRGMVYAIAAMTLLVLAFHTFSLFAKSLAFFFRVLSPFLVALILAYILSPIVVSIQRKLKLGRVMGTLIVNLVILLVVFLLLTYLVPIVLSQMIDLFQTLNKALPVWLDTLSENRYFKVDRQLIESLRDRLSRVEIDYRRIADALVPAVKQVASGGVEAFGVVSRALFSSIGSVAGFFSFVAFVVVINFYLILDWEKIGPILNKLAPPKYRDTAQDVFKKLDTAVGGFLRGQLTVAGIVGGLFAVGLFVMSFIGFPALRNYCILIGAVAGVAGFVPYLGSIIGVTPALLIVLFSGGASWNAKIAALLGVVGLFALIQAIEGFVLQPKIVGKGAGLHPLLIILALVVGAQFGIMGMVVAVPTACIVRVLFQEFVWSAVEKRDGRYKGETGSVDCSSD